jgi:hypothetical protein
MRLPCFAVLFVAVASSLVAQDELPPQIKDGKVCVATVGNASAQPALVERLTERLTKSLKQNKIDPLTMHSRTADKHPLELTTDNSEEVKEKGCDYVLLSQVRNPRQHPLEPQVPEISIGGRVPSVDASDPGPVYRENLQVDFALFQVGRFKPVLDTYVLERASANVSDSFLPAMDHEANRVSHELKKH